MYRSDKLISFLGSRVAYWLRTAELATATPGTGPFADWVAGLLDIRPDDIILELGCGTDTLMKSILKAHQSVLMAALDPSARLIARAWRENARTIRQGRAMLIQAAIPQGLPAFVTPFSKVVAINPTILGDRPAASLKAVRAAMAPRGKIVLVFQPETAGADLGPIGREFRQHLAAAGFTSLWINEKRAEPANAVCISGLAPAGTRH